MRTGKSLFVEFRNYLLSGKRGVIEDLYPFLDDGTWPQREDFVDNILSCFEEDGSLYGITPFFKIVSVAADPDVIATDSITFAQMRELYEENRGREEITVYNALDNRMSLAFDACIRYSLDEFVDMENRSCDFQKEEFREIVEFLAQFSDNTAAGGTQDLEELARLQEGNLYLYFDGPIGGFRDYTHYRELTGKDAVLVGFPGIGGCTPQVNTNFPYLTVNRESRNKDAAWQFICTFLDDRYLTNDDNIGSSKGFPVTKSGFERLARKTVDTNPSGGEGSISDVNGNTFIYPVCATTEEEIAYIEDVVAKIVPYGDYDEIDGMIWEELESYWSGAKTVQEVTAIIQNRVQLYLDEM